MTTHEESVHASLLLKIGFKPYIPEPQTKAEQERRLAMLRLARERMSPEENAHWEIRDKAFGKAPWFFVSFGGTLTIAMDEHRNKWKATGTIDLESLGFKDLTPLILIDCTGKQTPTLQ